MGRFVMRPSICIAIAGLLSFGTYSSVALAQSWNGAYYCVDEVAGGLAYDATTKKWKGTGFNTDEKFVLRLQYKGRSETKEEYEVTITESGKSEAARCIRPHAGNRLVGVDSNGWMEECSAFLLLSNYIFK